MERPIVNELFLNRPLQLQEVKKIIFEGNYGLEDFGTYLDNNLKISYGIEYAFLSEAISIEEIMDAIRKFTQKDFGNFLPAKMGKQNQYGCYDSQYGCTPETGAIMIHQNEENVVIHFQFEEAN